MKESEKLTVYVGTFITVMVGYFVLLIVSGFITDLVSGIVFFPESGSIGEFAVIEYLTPPRLSWLVYGVGWFVVCLLVNYGSTRSLEEGEKLDILSSFFLILWFVTTLAIVAGFLLKSLAVSALSWEGLFDLLFVALFWALAPTIAVIHGVNDKSQGRG
ncbi:MAG: hypothetical protein ACXAC6_00765 [Candidatus Hodarchaeales archaeon]|jgi:hypothetical protein